MAAIITHKPTEHQLEDLAKALPVPTNRSRLATEICKQVLNAKSPRELLAFVRELRPDWRRKFSSPSSHKSTGDPDRVRRHTRPANSGRASGADESQPGSLA